MEFLKYFKFPSKSFQEHRNCWRNSILSFWRNSMERTLAKISSAFKAWCLCFIFLIRLTRVVLTADRSSAVSRSSFLTFTEYYCFLNCLLHLFPSRYATLYIRDTEGFFVKLHSLLQISTSSNLESGFVFFVIASSQIENLWSEEYSLQRGRMLWDARGTTACPQVCLLDPGLHKIGRKN